MISEELADWIGAQVGDRLNYMQTARPGAYRQGLTQRGGTPEDARAYREMIRTASDPPGPLFTVRGTLIRFTDPGHANTFGSYFDRNSRITTGGPIPLFYRHGDDPEIGTRQIGRADLYRGEDGIWFEGRVSAADAHGMALRELIRRGLLGASPGGLAGSYEVVEKGGAAWYSRYSVLEGSLTPVPADPETTVTLDG